jgi:predicted phage terminase large subunit-like protein
MQIPTLEQIEKEICRRSYYDFFLEAFQVLEPSTAITSNWHIEYLCNELQALVEQVGQNEPKTKDCIINIPPRNFKSMLTTVCLNAWAWIDYPQLRFISCSYSASLATEHCQLTRRLIQSDWYQGRFSDCFKLSGDQNQKTFFQNDKGGQRQISSTDSSSTGKGGDIIIFDDILNPKLSKSQVERQNANDYYFKTMYSRLNQPSTGVRLIVEQRLHEDDITGLCLSIAPSEYKHICLPAESTQHISPAELVDKYQDDLLFPERLSKQELSRFKTNLGSEQYATQYLQQPVPEGGLMIKSDWLQQRFTLGDLPIGITKHFVSDTAYGNKNGGDYNATLCYSIHNNNLYCWNYYHSIDDFPTFLANHQAFLQSNGYTNQSISWFEPKATGQSIVQSLKSFGLNVKELESPKDSKVVRTGSVTAMLEAGRVYFQSGINWQPVIEECKMFPNGKHDDLVDVLVNALNKIKVPESKTSSIEIANIDRNSYEIYQSSSTTTYY